MKFWTQIKVDLPIANWVEEQRATLEQIHKDDEARLEEELKNARYMSLNFPSDERWQKVQELEAELKFSELITFSNIVRALLEIGKSTNPSPEVLREYLRRTALPRGRPKLKAVSE